MTEHKTRRPAAIKVQDVSKTFKLPHEQHNSIKSALINLIGANRGYEVQHVLNDINFEIRPGEFFGIVGRNGSGKSTLLKLLAGIYTPNTGAITVHGSVTPFIELGVGFNPELSGRENVYLNGALLGFNRKEVDGMYDDIVEFAELGRFMDQKLKNYSSGMQVRLAFSIAIRARSDILILDEVLAVGDEAFQNKCTKVFLEYKNDPSKTVVLVTHDMSAVEKFCSRAALLSEGEMVMVGDPAEVAARYRDLNVVGTAPTMQQDKSAKVKQVNLANELVEQVTVSAAELPYEQAFTVDITLHNDGTKPRNLVAGVNLYKTDDPYNPSAVEYNTYDELGDQVLQAGERRVFSAHIQGGQLYKGSYLVRPHVLDVDNKYRFHGATEEYCALKVTGANKSKSGSFNIAGSWSSDATE